MSKFKVGDRVRMSAEGKARFEEDHDNPYNIEGSIDEWDEEDDDLEWRVKWDNSELNWYASNNIEPVSATNTLTVGNRYTSANGSKWECLAIKGDTAWMVGVYGGKATGTAYSFKLDGTPICLGCRLGLDKYRIVFEPVREEWADYADTDHGRVYIEYTVLDGKPDW